MKTYKLLVITILLVAGMLVTSASAEYIYSVLHEFQGGENDGLAPYTGNLTLYDGALYGMTSLGGTYNQGAIFKYQLATGNFSLLHSFTGTGTEGKRPLGGLTLSGGVFYGTTMIGGIGGFGTVFKINPDGTGFTTLLGLERYVQGALLYGDPTVSGGKIYAGTRGDNGTVFSMNLDGSGFSTLYAGGAVEYGALPIAGDYIFGAGADGTIFKVKTDGSESAILHTFGEIDPTDGIYATSAMILSGDGTLYGMTSNGGDFGGGTIFKIKQDGSDYSILYDFGSIPNDGLTPGGSLTLSGDILYGTTTAGGDSNLGTMFKINLDGSGYSIIHSFDSAMLGKVPAGNLLISGDFIYGVTSEGGAAGNGGVLFSYGPASTGDVPEPSTLLLLLPFIGFGLRRKYITAPQGGEHV